MTTMRDKELAVLNLFKSENALVKMMRSKQGNQDHENRWNDFLRQLHDPYNYRPKYHKPNDTDGCTIYNPKTGEEEFRSRAKVSGTVTPYIRKTDVTLARADGKTNYFALGNCFYNVGLVFDLSLVDQQKLKAGKYIFSDSWMGTDDRSWVKPTEGRRSYWGRDKIVRSETLEHVREYNRQTPWGITHLMVAPRLGSLKAIVVRHDNVVDRLNGLYNKYRIKKKLNLDLPIIILPESDETTLKTYTAAKQYMDILDIRSKIASTHGITVCNAFINYLNREGFINDIKQELQEKFCDKSLTFSTSTKLFISQLIQYNEIDLLEVYFKERGHEQLISTQDLATYYQQLRDKKLNESAVSLVKFYMNSLPDVKPFD